MRMNPDPESDLSPAGLAELMQQHRQQLRRMVRLRMDPRIQARIDPSDVVQEAYVEATERYADYCRNPTMPRFIWLRFLTGQRLLRLHREHLGVKARDAGREVSLCRGALPEATSAALAAQLVGRVGTPSSAAQRAERKRIVQEALNEMAPLDREVLALRHFEQLSNAETAAALGLDKSAASKRYVRALKRMRTVLRSPPGCAPGLGETSS